jgi:transposase-like protein
VVEVQRRRSRAEAEQVVSEYEGSGLSRVEFCRKHGLSLATLARYRKRQAQGKAEPGNRWVTVEVSGASSARENRGGQRSGGGVAGWPSHRSRARV